MFPKFARTLLSFVFKQEFQNHDLYRKIEVHERRDSHKRLYACPLFVCLFDCFVCCLFVFIFYFYHRVIHSFHIRKTANSAIVYSGKIIAYLNSINYFNNQTSNDKLTCGPLLHILSNYLMFP